MTLHTIASGNGVGNTRERAIVNLPKISTTLKRNHPLKEQKIHYKSLNNSITNNQQLKEIIKKGGRIYFFIKKATNAALPIGTPQQLTTVTVLRSPPFPCARCVGVQGLPWSVFARQIIRKP